MTQYKYDAANNCLRQSPGMEKPNPKKWLHLGTDIAVDYYAFDREEYRKHLTTLNPDPITLSGDVDWEDGKIVEEGKDFKLVMEVVGVKLGMPKAFQHSSACTAIPIKEDSDKGEGEGFWHNEIKKRLEFWKKNVSPESLVKSFEEMGYKFISKEQSPASPVVAEREEILKELLVFVNDMTIIQTLTNGCDIQTIHIPSLLHKIEELIIATPTTGAKDNEGYWKKRCEAAETVIDEITGSAINFNGAMNVWQSLRQSPPTEQSTHQVCGMWVNEKPDLNKECLVITASIIRNEWHYTLYEIKKVNSGEGWYWSILQDGDEWGDLADLHADKYLILTDALNKQK